VIVSLVGAGARERLDDGREARPVSVRLTADECAVAVRLL